MNDSKQDFHWFTSSIFNWCTDADLSKCIDKQKRADNAAVKSMNGGKTPKTRPLFRVYRVPLSESAEYSIEDFRPQVEGTEFIACCNGESV